MAFCVRPIIRYRKARLAKAPLDNRVIELNKGHVIGFTGLIPVGGHWQAISGVGVKALWRNAQKNLKKNKTSDRIKSAILQ